MPESAPRLILESTAVPGKLRRSDRLIMKFDAKQGLPIAEWASILCTDGAASSFFKDLIYINQWNSLYNSMIHSVKEKNLDKILSQL